MNKIKIYSLIRHLYIYILQYFKSDFSDKRGFMEKKKKKKIALNERPFAVTSCKFSTFVVKLFR
jgi:hypothetical protein